MPVPQRTSVNLRASQVCQTSRPSTMGLFSSNSAERAEHRAETGAQHAASLLGGAGTSAIHVLDQVHVSNVKPYVCCGLCCAHGALGINWPACFGCSTQGVCCACIEYGSATCKPVKAKPVNCVCQSGFCVFVDSGKTLCQHQCMRTIRTPNIPESVRRMHTT